MGNTDKFEMIASLYDTDERIEIARKASDAIRELLVNTEDKNAIDFGCGTGLVGMNLLDNFNSVLFLDSSKNMLEQIKKKLSSVNTTNADTLCFDFETDNLLNLNADYIFMSQVLLHIEDFKSLLTKLYNVLNPKGHLIIIDFNKNDSVVSSMVHNGFDQEELANIMLKIGYKSITSKTFFDGNKIFMGKDASLFILDSQK